MTCAVAERSVSRSTSSRAGNRVWSKMRTDQPSSSSQMERYATPSISMAVQKSEVGRQRSKDRIQRSEVRISMAEVRRARRSIGLYDANREFQSRTEGDDLAPEFCLLTSVF